MQALFDASREKEREEYLRAGLIAATIVNVHRRRGARAVSPSDFLQERPRPEDYMDAETATAFMDRWARQTQEAAVAQPPEGWEGNSP